MKKSIAWLIQNDAPVRLDPGAVGLEKHLEDWIDADVDIVADDVVIIGRQLRTRWGTVLDLLGVDEDGNLVVMELKRNQTLRETVAQSLEYASWVAKLGYEEVVSLGANRHGSEDAFREAFENRFGHPLPEALNALQRVLVVAPNIDDATADVVDYLASTYRVPINAVSFDVFDSPAGRLLVRHYAIEASEAPAAPASVKVRQSRGMEDALLQAEQAGIRPLVEKVATLNDLFKWGPFVAKTGWTWYLPAPSDPSGVSATRVIIKPGALGITLRADNLSAAFGKPLESAEAFIQGLSDGLPIRTIGKGFRLFTYTEMDEVEDFVARFRAYVSGDEPAPSTPTEEPLT